MVQGLKKVLPPHDGSHSALFLASAACCSSCAHQQGSVPAYGLGASRPSVLPCSNSAPSCEVCQVPS